MSNEAIGCSSPPRIVGSYHLGGRDVPDGLEKSPIVEPVDPFERGVLDGFDRAPRTAPVDDLGLVEAVDRFGEGIVVAVADAPHGGFEAGLGEALGVFDRYVLHAAIAVMDEPAAGYGPADMKRLLQRVENEAGVSRDVADPPADNAASVGDRDRRLRRRMPGWRGKPLKSETHSRFGRGARNWRLTRSSGHGAALSLIVVFTRLPRMTPCRPILRMSRATVQRATSSPSRTS